MKSHSAEAISSTEAISLPHSERGGDDAAPGLFPFPAFCKWAGISRSAAYNEAAAGRLKLKKFGVRTMIDARDAIAWRDALPDADLRKAA